MKFTTIPAAFVCVSWLMFLPPALGAVRTAGLPTFVANLHLQQGEAFVNARSRLIKSGWVPIHVHAGDSYEYDGTEKRLIERKFYEVDSCSTDRGSLCALYYKKGSTCLRIDTVGEQVNSMQITRWEESCPTGEPSRTDINGSNKSLN